VAVSSGDEEVTREEDDISDGVEVTSIGEGDEIGEDRDAGSDEEDDDDSTVIVEEDSKLEEDVLGVAEASRDAEDNTVVVEDNSKLEEDITGVTRGVKDAEDNIVNIEDDSELEEDVIGVTEVAKFGSNSLFVLAEFSPSSLPLACTRFKNHRSALLQISQHRKSMLFLSSSAFAKIVVRIGSTPSIPAVLRKACNSSVEIVIDASASIKAVYAMACSDLMD
jgi:hypothetical protein